MENLLGIKVGIYEEEIIVTTLVLGCFFSQLRIEKIVLNKLKTMEATRHTRINNILQQWVFPRKIYLIFPD